MAVGLKRFLQAERVQKFHDLVFVGIFELSRMFPWVSWLRSTVAKDLQNAFRHPWTSPPLYSRIPTFSPKLPIPTFPPPPSKKKTKQNKKTKQVLKHIVRELVSVLPFSRNAKAYKFSFLVRIVPIWNTIPSSYVNADLPAAPQVAISSKLIFSMYFVRVLACIQAFHLGFYFDLLSNGVRSKRGNWGNPNREPVCRPNVCASSLFVC